MTNEDKVQSVYRFAACTYGACFGAALAGCCRNRTERDCDPCGGGKHRRSRTFGKTHAYTFLHSVGVLSQWQVLYSAL